jgi:riboflavin biosynthesis pyrimidine reductase
MVAMMLPSLVPMLRRYRQAVGRTGATRLGPLTAIVGAGYFIVWTVFGLALINDGSIDEYRLVICPIVLGGGRPLFSDKAASMTMKLVNTRTFDFGAVSLKYTHEQ